MRRDPHLEDLCRRIPPLAPLAADLGEAFVLCRRALESGGTLFLCGNGGSRADADHIAGELMKGFRQPRPLPPGERRELQARFSAEGARAADGLQRGLRTVVLGADAALTTAICNDRDPDLIFAQPLYVLGRPGDVLLALSTSGDARNVAMACRVALLKGLRIVGFTGSSGGLLASLATICIRVPATQTHLVQEYHLPIYHCLCAMLEEAFFPPTEAGH